MRSHLAETRRRLPTPKAYAADARGGGHFLGPEHIYNQSGPLTGQGAVGIGFERRPALGATIERSKSYEIVVGVHNRGPW